MLSHLTGEMELIGRKFVANLTVRPKTQMDGIKMLDSDPRKWRLKPSAYDAVVEEVGPGCTLIQPGDQIVVERWEYKQADWDDERIIADESQVLIVRRNGKETPTPGVVVMQIRRQDRPSTLIIPEHIRDKQRKKQTIYFGRVLASNSVICEVGEFLWVEKRDRHQFTYPDGRFIFLNCQDSWGEYPILMKAEVTKNGKR